MSYQIIWSQRAARDVEALDKKLRGRVIAKVESIKDNPYAYIKRLAGVPLYSLRVGDYRVILDVKNKELVVFVVRFGHRSRVYNEL